MGYITQLFSMKGKVCLISGASRGIGRSLADSFHDAGAVVFGLGRSEKAIDPCLWTYRQCDVNNKGQLTKVMEDIAETEGRFDVLINAAGITNSYSESDSTSSFFQMIQTNLIAVHETCLLASEYMKTSGGGSIINITSIASEIGFAGNPGYVSSKGGLKMLTKALANDLSPYNIRVNSIAPGYIRTDMTKGSYEDQTLNQNRVNRMIIKRWGETSDLSGAALLLASEASSYITGIDLFVDGGWTAKGL
jgi:NAD(P)-dependent dehydrogenase (short-subunit alcohol dehydrogenase family)